MAMTAKHIALGRLLEILVKCASSSVITILATLAISDSLNIAWAEDFPSRTVTFVEPGPPGGSPDTVIRILGEKLSQRWGVPVIVENKPGATGMIGAESVARGEASGHRLLFTFTALVQAPAVFPKVPYDLDRDFQPVSLVVTAPVMLVVTQDSSIKTLVDLITEAKTAEKPITYGSFGFGSSYHIYGEALKLSRQIDLLHVPYKGEALALTALLGGQIDSTFLSIGAGAPYVRAGKIRGLAIASKTRSTVLPDIPTFHEAGVDGIDAVGWFGVLAPAGTPADRVQKVANDIGVVLRDPAVVGRLREMGFEPIGSDPKDFREFLQTEAKKWKSLIDRTGVHLPN
jgi:tripartite-type tricarboxylate transporter receptor subunit TctC